VKELGGKVDQEARSAVSAAAERLRELSKEEAAGEARAQSSSSFVDTSSGGGPLESGKLTDEEADNVASLGLLSTAVEDEFQSVLQLVRELALQLEEVETRHAKDVEEDAERRRAQEEEEAAAQAASGGDLYARLARPLDEDQEAIVREAWDHSERDVSVVCSLPSGIGGALVDILGKHMSRMPGGWLFDETINNYMWLLQERDAKRLAEAQAQAAEADPHPPASSSSTEPASTSASSPGNEKKKPTFFFSSFFFEKMFENDQYAYGNVKRWSKKVKVTGGNVFLLDKMVVPVNVGNSHWCLCVAFVQQKKIQYFDSMGGPGFRFMRGLKQYFKDEAKKYRGQASSAGFAHLLNVDEWELVPTQNGTLQQTNGKDCGVFSCMFANYVSADLELRFSAQDMPTFRMKITHDLLREDTER